MKRFVTWSLFALILYLLGGVLFPISLWREFGSAAYGSTVPDGNLKAAAGFTDYARLYPQMILYPLCWFLPAVINLAFALNAIDQYAAERSHLRRLTFYLILGLFAIFACVAGIVEGTNPGLLLFEISPPGQQESVASVLHSIPNGTGETAISDEIPESLLQGSIAHLVLAQTLLEKTRASEHSKVEAESHTNLKKLNERIFAWDGVWQNRRDKLSDSRPLYQVSVATIVWTMLGIYLCTFVVAAMPPGPKRQPALLGTLGAAVAMLLWFPSRMYYNALTRDALFDEQKNRFNLWIPAFLRKVGLTATDAIPLLLFIICAAVIIVLILKFNVEKLINRITYLLGICGLSGAVIWAFLDPQKFGPAVGLDGNWPRFAVITCLLLAVFAAYFIFSIFSGCDRKD
jgi:hypothetical protein